MFCRDMPQPPTHRYRPNVQQPEPVAGKRFATNLLDWLPFLWSRAVSVKGACRRKLPAFRAAPIVHRCIGSVASSLPCPSSCLSRTKGVMPRSCEMLTRGEWIVPTLQVNLISIKPPLFYWLVMVCYRLFGFHDWAARLVPALAVQGTILLSFCFGRRLVGARAAFWGALVLCLIPGFVGMGRLLVLDGVLTFWVTLCRSSRRLASSGRSQPST